MFRMLSFFDVFFGFALICINSDAFELSRLYIVGIDDEIILQAHYKLSNQSNTVLNITWFKNSQQLVIGSRSDLIFQNGDSVLKINKAKKKDEGMYKCIIQLSDNSTFITNFHVIVHKDPLPNWAVALIVVGLILLLIATVIFFQCRNKLNEVVAKTRLTTKRHKTSETSFRD